MGLYSFKRADHLVVILHKLSGLSCFASEESSVDEHSRVHTRNALNLAVVDLRCPLQCGSKLLELLLESPRLKFGD